MRTPYNWGEWYPYGDCSSTCERGLQAEIRSCLSLNGTEVDLEKCLGGSDASFRFIECNFDDCPELTEWMPVGNCFLQRGDCVQENFRYCKEDGFPENSSCLYRTSHCPEDDCATGSGYGNWTAITNCSSECMPGEEIWMGFCIFFNNLTASPHCENDTILEVRECNEDLCTQYTQWQEQGDCSEPCGGGEQRSTRHCVHLGTEPDHCIERIESCNTHDCPQIDYGNFTEWGECDNECMPGNQTRTGICIDLSDGTASNECPNGPTITQERSCHTDFCVEFGDWMSSNCTPDCGPGNLTRTRICLEFGEGSPVQLPVICFQETQSCNNGPCVEYSDWTEYGPCDSDCSPGSHSRNRTCVLEGTDIAATGCGGPDIVVETNDCDTHLCDSYSDFVNASECTVVCQSAEQLLRRECLDGGVVPDGCNETIVPCIAGSASVIDLNIVVDSTNALDNQACTTGSPSFASVPWDHPVLQDNARFPNFFQQKQFFIDFFCKWNNVSETETRMSISAHDGSCIAQSIVHYLNDFEVLTAIEQLDYECGNIDYISNLACGNTQGIFTNANGGRNDAENVQVMVLSPDMDTTKGRLFRNLVTGELLAGFIEDNFDLLVFLTSNPNIHDPAEAANLKVVNQIACQDTAVISGCSKFIGSIYDPAEDVVARLVALLP